MGSWCSAPVLRVFCKRRRSSKVNIATSTTTKQCSDIESLVGSLRIDSVPVRDSVKEPLFPRIEPTIELTKNECAELGAVRFHWECLCKSAHDHARLQNKPIFHVIAESPGDINFAETVLSHPLIREAAETLFVSVSAIIAGHVRKQMPTDGPVVRTRIELLSQTGEEIFVSKQQKHLCTLGAVVTAMVEALQFCEKTVPEYLKLLAKETSCMNMGLDTCACRNAIFGVKCLAKAEVELAELDGVVRTRTGHVTKYHNALDVSYDSQTVCYSAIIRYLVDRQLITAVLYQANDEKVAAQVELTRRPCYVSLEKFSGALVSDVDSKHALRGSILRFVPLTSLQALHANRLVHMGAFDEAMHLLSPTQGRIIMQMLHTNHSKLPDLVNIPIEKAWLILTNLDVFREKQRHAPSILNKQCSS